MARCYKRHKNTCKMNSSLKNRKKIRHWIIGLKFFPLVTENSLLHAKKITDLPTVSFLFYGLKMESYKKQYDWYYLSSHIHKLLMHGADVIDNMLLPIGKRSLY